MVFVTSRRLWARLTRVLVVVMLVVLLVGATAYYWNNRDKQADAAKGGGGTAPASAVAAGLAAPANPPEAAAIASADRVSPAPAAGTGSPVVLPPLAPVPGNGKASIATAGQLAPARPSGTPLTPVADGGVPATPAAAKPAAPAAAPLPAAEADKLLADAKAKLDAGDPLAARGLLNDAIVRDRFPAGSADAARALQARANDQLVFSPRPYAGDGFAEVARIEKGNGLVTLARSHAVPWELVCRINGTTDKRIKIGQALKTPVGPFHGMVTKSAFRLDLFLGGVPGEANALYVTSLPVGLGKDDSTPTGLWEVVPAGKMKNPHWTNPRSGESFQGYDPKNPLGGYWIALKGVDGNAAGKSGFGIHGTIEPESIGKQASMGCIRLKVEDVQLVYDMLTDRTNGSRVLVRD